MRYPDFSFETNSLGAEHIEFKICEHYKLGFPETSKGSSDGFSPDYPKRVTIIADKGTIVCSVYVVRKEDGIYRVSANFVDIKTRKK